MSKNFNNIAVQNEFTHSETTENQKLSIEKCKKILNAKGFQYNNEKVTQIREFLYQLARLDLIIYNNICYK